MFVKRVKDMRITWAEVHVEREREREREREGKKDPSYQILIIRHDVSRRGAFCLHFHSFFFNFKYFLNFDFLFFINCLSLPACWRQDINVCKKASRGIISYLIR